MDSGLYAKVFTSTEVIAASLFLILLLPLVFFIASTKSRRRLVPTTRFVKPAKRTRTAAPQPAEEPAEDGPRRRAVEREEDDGPDADDRR